VTSEINPRSFDRPRERVAPTSLNGHWSGGAEVLIDLTEVTLVVAIKTNCDGCRAFLDADLSGVGAPVIVISADDDGVSEWRDAGHPVLVSSDAFRQLDLRSAPFYVLIDPMARRVVTEGVLFGPAQVAAEIAPYLQD
jgi:hypothetical protein